MSARPLRRPVPLNKLISESRLKEVTALLGPDNQAVQQLKQLLQESPPTIPSRPAFPKVHDTPSGTGNGSAWPVSSQRQNESPTPEMAACHTASSPNEKTLAAQSSSQHHPQHTYQPFPVDVLPQPIQQFITQQSASLNCDAASIALPVLSVLASALGGHQRIQLKPDVSEPAILWTAVVRDDMATYDPGLEAAIAPLRKRQTQAFQQQQSVMLKYRHQLASFRSNQRRYPDGSYPPVEPLAERTMTVDWTIPNLSRLLSKQSRGMLICPLELDGWLEKSASNGAKAIVERQAWFDLHVGRSVMIEGRTPINLSSGAVSLTGTLSPEVLAHRLTKSRFACGFTSRLLFAAPPALPPCWRDEVVDKATRDGYASVIDKLFAHSTQNEVSSGANTVSLSPAATNLFSEFVTDLGARLEQIDEILYAWTANLPSHAARLALVIHLSRWAAGEAVDPNLCDEQSLRSGIVLARWFLSEAHRFLHQQDQATNERDLQQLYAWLQRKATPITARDLCRHNRRKYPTTESAAQALDALATTGRTRWTNSTPSPHGGRPTKRMELVLRQGVTSTGWRGSSTSEPPETAGQASKIAGTFQVPISSSVHEPQHDQSTQTPRHTEGTVHSELKSYAEA